MWLLRSWNCKLLVVFKCKSIFRSPFILFPFLPHPLPSSGWASNTWLVFLSFIIILVVPKDVGRVLQRNLQPSLFSHFLFSSQFSPSISMSFIIWCISVVLGHFPIIFVCNSFLGTLSSWLRDQTILIWSFGCNPSHFALYLFYCWACSLVYIFFSWLSVPHFHLPP